MKSYLEACGVPTAHIGQVELPRLIMGIHPYDGCSYVDRQRDAGNRCAFDRAAKVADVLCRRGGGGDSGTGRSHGP